MVDMSYNLQVSWAQGKTEPPPDNDNVQNDNLTYDDIPLVKPIKYGKCYTTNPMIWVGVLPDTLTGAVAHESAAETLSFLNDIDKMRVES